jgi:hypothetical protein
MQSHHQQICAINSKIVVQTLYTNVRIFLLGGNRQAGHLLINSSAIASLVTISVLEASTGLGAFSSPITTAYYQKITGCAVKAG